MGIQFQEAFPLTIPSGAAVSNSLEVAKTIGDAFVVGIQSPSTLDALTFKLQVSYDNATWADLYITDSVVLATLPATGLARPYYDLCCFKYIRAAASGNVASDRVFIVSKQAVG